MFCYTNSVDWLLNLCRLVQQVQVRLIRLVDYGSLIAATTFFFRWEFHPTFFEIVIHLVSFFFLSFPSEEFNSYIFPRVKDGHVTLLTRKIARKTLGVFRVQKLRVSLKAKARFRGTTKRRRCIQTGENFSNGEVTFHLGWLTRVFPRADRYDRSRPVAAARSTRPDRKRQSGPFLREQQKIHFPRIRPTSFPWHASKLQPRSSYWWSWTYEIPLFRVTAGSVTREGEEGLRESLERSLDVLDEITAVEARDESPLLGRWH